MHSRFIVKIPLLIIAAAWCGTLASGQEVALNDGFEMENWTFWTETGTLSSDYRFVSYFDTKVPGEFSFAYGQSPFTGDSGGLSQTVYVIAGVAYEVRADICYTVC